MVIVMNQSIKDKIDDIICIFQNSNEIKEMLILKDDLLKDEKIINMLNEYKNLLNNPYDSRCIEIKKELLNIPKFKKYKDYEEKLFFLILNINRSLEKLKPEKSCIR